MVKVYLVMPDLSRAKIEALTRLSHEQPVSILVSYSTIIMKPVTLERLRELRRRAYSLEVMLDSGAYHMARLGLEISVASYADFALKHQNLFDVVVAPDVPGDCEATLRRTLEFKRLYRGPLLPVVQGRTVEEYIYCYTRLQEAGLVDGALGVGGLDGERRKQGFLGSLLAQLCTNSAKLHLFGVGARLYKALTSRYGYCIASIDTGAWQAEIYYRRRTELKADSDVTELEYKAMKRYLERFSQPPKELPRITAQLQSSTLYKAGTPNPH